MYHALDRANQRAVLQEQPHVSNFISGKVLKDGMGSSTSGSNVALATAAGGAVAGPAADAAAVAAARGTSAFFASAAADHEVIAETSGTAAAAAAASAATRMVLATGRGGGGGQRPAGVTQAQHRSLIALKVERERRLRGQQRLAAAGVTKASSSLSSTTRENRSLRTAATISGAGSRECDSGGASGRLPLSSIPAAMRADPPSSPAAAASAVGGVFGFRSPTNGGCTIASRMTAPSSSCSDGLRKAARLALRKNDLMSPTLKRLLQNPSQLRTTSSVAPTDIASPGSEESGLDTEVGGDGCGAGVGGDGDGGGGRMTPSELRGSTTGASLLSTERGDSSSGGDDSFFSSSSSSSDENEEGTGEDIGIARKRRRNIQLPTRVLFGNDEEKGTVGEQPQQQQSPKQQRISAIARAAANASATRHAALEMKPPPPRLPTSAAAVVAPTAAAAAAKTPISSLPTEVTVAAARVFDGLASPCASARDSVDCTPTKGILMDRSTPKGCAAAAATASSTVKRRVRFEVEERTRAAASLTSPCRSSSPSAAGLWSRASDDDDDDVYDRGYGCDDSGEYYGERRSFASLRVVLIGLAVSFSVGVVALLGGGNGGGSGSSGVGVGSGGRAYYDKTAPTLVSSTSSPSSGYSPIGVPWVEQQHRQKLDVCQSVDIPYSLDGDTKPSVAAVKEEDWAMHGKEPEDATAGEALMGKEASDDAPAYADLVEETPNQEDAVGEASGAAVVFVHPSANEEDVVDGRQEEDDEGQGPAWDIHPTTGGASPSRHEEEEEEQEEQGQEVDHDRRLQTMSQRQHQHEHHHYHQGGEEIIGETGSRVEDGGDARPSGDTTADPGYSTESSSSSPSLASASGFSSMWGWFEVAAAMIGAAALLATAVIWKSWSSEEWGGGGGLGAGDGPSTPGGGEGGGDGDGEGEQLGRYETVEMIKTGGTPATLRSVKRSRRIGSAQVR